MAKVILISMPKTVALSCLFRSALFAQQDLPQGTPSQTVPNASPAAVMSPKAGRSLHPPVSATNRYHRIICVVPFIGTGKPNDPRRPQYIPAPSNRAPSLQGIIAFQQIPTDNRRFAIVEYAAADRVAFTQILNDKTLQVFEKGKHSRVLIEQALKLVRKDFDLSQFGMAVR